MDVRDRVTRVGATKGVDPLLRTPMAPHQPASGDSEFERRSKYTMDASLILSRLGYVAGSAQLPCASGFQL